MENQLHCEYTHLEPFTVCVVKEGDLEAIGIAKCMFKDSYDEDKGMEISGKRAMRTLEKKKLGLPITTRLAG